MSNFSFFFSFAIIFVFFGENHAGGLGPCTSPPSPTGCQDEVYDQAQCQAMFNTGPNGVLNTALCTTDDAWVTQALHCAATCQICRCRQQQTGKNDEFLCGAKGTGAGGKLGEVKKNCEKAKNDRNLIVYMSLNSTCPEECPSWF